MKTKIRRFLARIPFFGILIELYLLKNQYLKDIGWNLSTKKGLPIDNNGLAIPWFTYPSIKFLEERLNHDLKVFEFGSGHSTLWFKDKVKSIISVEHHQGWFNKMKPVLNENQTVTYLYRQLENHSYSTSVLDYKEEFDVIILDGRNRVECCLNSIQALTKQGIIIWDNSDRAKYSKGYNFLVSQGFKRLDFWGLGPINSYSWCTSIFYKDNNCLNL